MKLYIAMIASVIAISGCKKDEDTGGDTSGAGGGGGGGGGTDYCADLAASYCGCDGVDADMCDAYTASLADFTSEQCQPTLDAWDAAGGCDALTGG